MKYLILSLLLSSVAYAAPTSPQWKIIKTKSTTPDTVIAGYNVVDFGAKAMAKPIAPRPFSRPWTRWPQAGGGTVFVPAGPLRHQGDAP